MNENKMNKQESDPTNVPANPPTSEPVNAPKDKQTVQSELEKEMAKWRTKMDEAKVQLHLGAKEAQDKIQPYVDQLEQELAEANKKWKELETATESACLRFGFVDFHLAQGQPGVSLQLCQFALLLQFEQRELGFVSFGLVWEKPVDQCAAQL